MSTDASRALLFAVIAVMGFALGRSQAPGMVMLMDGVEADEWVDEAPDLSLYEDILVYDHQLMAQELAYYAAAFPEVMAVDTIGYSVEGRPLLLARVGRGSARVFALASIHGREYISTALLMKNLEELMRGYSEGYVVGADDGADENDGPIGGYDPAYILNSCTLYLLPMVNPDGVAIAQRGAADRDSTFLSYPLIQSAHGYRCWKANGRGVDLNRNFENGWSAYKGKPGPCSENYKGTHPLSEPEAQALVAALDSVRPDAVLSYHTQGEVLYMSTPRPIDRTLARVVQDVTSYRPLPVGAAYGSLQDHVDDRLGVFYACVELCPSVGPYPYPESEFYNRVWGRGGKVLYAVATALANENK